jgi:hypothetical protein
MAINPNTDFTAGAILTADQQNRFGRGVMALSSLTANTTVTQTEATRTSVTFTAVANRYYKIWWVEQGLNSGANTTTTTFLLRPTSTATAAIATTNWSQAGSFNNQAQCVAIATFAAGSVTIFARVLTSNAGGATLAASATAPSYLVVEDIGPA